jgi:aromatic ring-opening dioxygenase catalytic subunit (LigB family)
MAKVDLSFFDTVLKGLYIVHQPPTNNRVSKRIKRAWKRAGRPASLRTWVQTLALMDADANKWVTRKRRSWRTSERRVEKLRFQELARQAAKAANFGVMYGMSATPAMVAAATANKPRTRAS